MDITNIEIQVPTQNTVSHHDMNVPTISLLEEIRYGGGRLKHSTGEEYFLRFFRRFIDVSVLRVQS